MRPGRNDQVVLRRQPQKYPQFEFRNVAASGKIWTGQGTATEHRVPSLETLPRNQWPDENVLSIAFRLSYGKFKFFNGGDLPGIRPNSPAWYDMETPVAKVVGPVDAAILDHHGYLDSMNESLVATLSARVWTISVWDAHHPTPSVWERLQSERLYPGARGIYAQPDSKMIVLETVARPTGHDESGFLGCPYGSPRCFFHAAADSLDSQ